MKIIVIEPHPTVLMLATDALTIALGKDLAIVTAPQFTGSQKIVSKHLDADMAFVAYDAPTGRGGKIAQELKSMAPHLKVILTSTVAGPETAERLGLDGFLPKENFFPPAELKRFIDLHLAQAA